MNVSGLRRLLVVCLFVEVVALFGDVRHLCGDREYRTADTRFQKDPTVANQLKRAAVLEADNVCRSNARRGWVTFLIANAAVCAFVFIRLRAVTKATDRALGSVNK